MEIAEFIQAGMTNELSFHVEEQFTAVHIGSGSLKVVATPSMIGFMERAARDLLEQRLPDGFSSVGVHVDVHHLAPTPLGNEVRVKCEVTEVEGRRVAFSVAAWDEHEIIGEGFHERVVIDTARFLKRVQSKEKAR